MDSNRTALVAGAGGLVGGHLLQLLLADESYGKVVLPVRRWLDKKHAKLQQQVVNWEKISDYGEQLRADDLFCCLGTTIKKAGSQRAFVRVDCHYPLQLAQLAKSVNARSYVLVTAMGADPGSRIFYNRVKGEVEQAIKQLHLASLTIVRPSLLLGERTEFRLGERLITMAFRPFSFLFSGPLLKYRPIHARIVATAMWQAARNPQPEVRVIESDEMHKASHIYL
jgi:uncharacterized protein YbjT (DUF2867 family)